MQPSSEPGAWRSRQFYFISTLILDRVNFQSARESSLGQYSVSMLFPFSLESCQLLFDFFFLLEKNHTPTSVLGANVNQIQIPWSGSTDGCELAVGAGIQAWLLTIEQSL